MLEAAEALPAQPIDPPTITVTFGINDSPLAGREGKKVQSRGSRERLMKEAERKVAIRGSDTPGGEAFEVAGRGELQMGVLIENMRREGFELSISRPQVIFRDVDGAPHEPVEEVTVDVDGTPVEALRYTLSTERGDIRLWYSRDGLWLALEAPAKGGRTLRYRALQVPGAVAGNA